MLPIAAMSADLVRLCAMGATDMHFVSLSEKVLMLQMKVYYEDMENGDRLEAYCSLKHCYSLPGCDDLWICHGYYDDKEDLQALEMGRRFLQHTDIHDKELVARTGAWHSRAQVVEGIFQLKRSLHDFSMAVNAEDSKIENFWCDKQWDPATGQSLRCYSENAKHAARRSCSFNSRFILS